MTRNRIHHAAPAPFARFALIAALVATAAATPGCGLLPFSEGDDAYYANMVQVCEVAPSTATDVYDASHAKAWVRRWEHTFADYRGRVVCSLGSRHDGTWYGQYYTVHQFACENGACTCMSGYADESTPDKVATFTADLAGAPAAARRACEFPDDVTGFVVETPSRETPYWYIGGGSDASAQPVDGPVGQATLSSPLGVEQDADGVLYITESKRFGLRLVKDGKVSTIKSKYMGQADGALYQAEMLAPGDMVADRTGGGVYLIDDLRVRLIKDHQVRTVAGTGVSGCQDGPALSATFTSPTALALRPDGTLLIGDAGCGTVRALAGGKVTTVAGNPNNYYSRQDGPALSAGFMSIEDLVVSKDGATVYILDDEQVRKLEGGKVTTLPLDRPSSMVTAMGALALTPSGELLVLDSGAIWKLRAGRVVKHKDAPNMYGPTAATLDSKGRLLIADTSADAILLMLP